MRFMLMSFTLIGLLVAVLMKMQNPSQNFMYLCYPCNAYAMTAILCGLGEYLADSVSSD